MVQYSSVLFTMANRQEINALYSQSSRVFLFRFLAVSAIALSSVVPISIHNNGR